MARQIEVGQNAQGDQSRNALPVGWDLVQGVAPVILGDGLDPLGLVIGQVFGGEAAPMGFGKALNGFGNFATIKRLPFAGSNGSEATGRVFEAKQFAHFRGTTPRQKALGKAGL